MGQRLHGFIGGCDLRLRSNGGDEIQSGAGARHLILKKSLPNDSLAQASFVAAECASQSDYNDCADKCWRFCNS
jgi:hypothetical protein